MTKPVDKKYNFTFKCDKSGEMEHINNTPATFKCPHCGLLLHFIEKERKLGSHGRTEKTIGHKLRVAEELGSE